MQKANTTSSYPKEYRLRTYWLSVSILFASWVALGWQFYKVLGIVIRNPKLWFLIITMPVEIYIFILSWYLIKDFRLKITPEGITYILWSREIYADWSQVKWSRHLHRSQKLSLENPTVTKRKEWSFLGDIFKRRDDRSFQMIPYTKFTWGKFNG